MEFVEGTGSEFGTGEYAGSGSFGHGKDDGKSPQVAGSLREFQTQESACPVAFFEYCLTVRIWG
jgi:hypothetical protein